MRKAQLRSSQIVAVVAVFAALNVITDSFGRELPTAGVWYSWNFMIEPLTGIVLGPFLGSAATFLGVMIGHYVNPIDVYEFVFTIGAPIGAAVSALLFRGKWQPVLIYYSGLFAIYFITPVAWQLPLWGMWDTYLAFAILIAAIFLIRKGFWNSKSKKLPLILIVSAFIGLEADVLFRIFLFIPGQTYRLFYGYQVEDLQYIWSVGGFITPIKVAISTIATVMIGHPVIRALRKTAFWRDQ